MARFDYTTTYPLRDVMAASVMAYRLNGDEYIFWQLITNTVTEFDKDADNYIIRNHTNKHLMLYSVTDATPPDNLMHPKVNFFFDNVADAEDYAVADEIISYYQGLVLKAMGATINEFEQKILGLIKSGKVAANEFGIVASLPKSYFRSVERDAVEAQQRALSDDSQYVGKIGDTVELAIDVLRCNFIQKLNCHVVNARAGNDLIVFFTSNANDFDGMRCGNIKGRVKRHQTSNYHGGKETVLNYVKKI
jgi:hypothetical protein